MAAPASELRPWYFSTSSKEIETGRPLSRTVSSIGGLSSIAMFSSICMSHSAFQPCVSGRGRADSDRLVFLPRFRGDSSSAAGIGQLAGGEHRPGPLIEGRVAVEWAPGDQLLGGGRQPHGSKRVGGATRAGRRQLLATLGAVIGALGPLLLAGRR